MKCERCRNDHKTCTPPTRHWGQRQEEQRKCDRCLHLGHDCGPPMRAPVKGSSVLDGATMSDQLASLHLHPSNTNTQDTYSRDLRPGPSGPRPVVPWNKLPVAVATAELLTTYELRMHRCQGLLEALPCHAELKHRIQVINKTLSLKWHQLLEEAVGEARDLHRPHGTSPQERIILLQRIYQMRQEQRTRLDSQSHTSHGPVTSSSSGFPIQITQMDDLDVLGCTSNTLTQLNSSQFTAVSELEHYTQFLTATKYVSLSQWIQCLLMEDFNAVNSQPNVAALSSRGESENGISAPPFPPAHIAFLNHHLELVLQIWAEQPNDLDIFDRPLPFLVVESGNLQMLNAMTTRNHAAIKDPIVDAGGLSLLDVAVISGDENTFSWLVGAGCNTSDPQRLLHLAVITGNSAIVEQIVNQPGMGLVPPWTTVILLAIDQMNAEVARVFLSDLRYRSWHSKEVLNYLAGCAQEQGLDSLAAELRGMEPVFPTAEDGLASLDAIQPQHYNMLAQQIQFPPVQSEFHHPTTTSMMDFNSTLRYQTMQLLPDYQANTNFVPSQIAQLPLYPQPNTFPQGAPNLWHAHPPSEAH